MADHETPRPAGDMDDNAEGGALHFCEPAELLAYLERQGVDVMTQALATYLAAISEALARDDDWDSPPAICYVVREQDDGAIHLQARPLPMPDIAISDPVGLLTTLGEGFIKHPSMTAAMVNFDIVAWLFVSEAWSVSYPQSERRNLDEYRRGDLASDPRREEVRIVAATDRAGNHYQIMTARATQDQMMAIFRTGENSPELDMRVPKALRALIDATPLGV